MKGEYIYHFHERMWHWAQATIMLALMGTGLEIHWPEKLSLLGFSRAARAHEWLGVLLATNAVLGFLYHLFSRQLRQYVPELRSFFGLALLQARYYLVGIFRGEAHPVQKTVARKMNPLQQITYLAILNLLLPLQLFTGVALWGSRHFPWVAESLRTLPYLGPAHMMGAWLFMAFTILHIYLATTGHTVVSNFQAMITGYEDLEVVASHPKETTR